MNDMTSDPDRLGAAAVALAHAADVADHREQSNGPRRPRRGGLPDDCTVTPVGHNDGTFYYLDASAQLRGLRDRDHGRNGLSALFGGDVVYLTKQWPKIGKDGTIQGFRPDAVTDTLIRACTNAGIWRADERVRGVGAWLDDEGGLVLHCGDKIWLQRAWRDPGVYGGLVYSGAPPVARPLILQDATGAFRNLLVLLKSWCWRRPDVDPFLMLGWLAAARHGGALDWRPAAWVTGDRGTGKSTLQGLIGHVMGQGGIIQASDATGAGIWQRLGHSTVPVALDEMEADEDNRQAQKVIKLAREASSGGVVLRGGSDHSAAQFRARSAFLFSSILTPPLSAQDRSRLAVLELDPLDSSAPPPSLDRKKLGELGQAMQQRFIEQWSRWTDTLHAYRAAMVAAGHSGRGADQFGTLLACADMLLHDHPPSSDDLALWSERMGRDALAETADNDADHERCLLHLATSIVDHGGGGAKRTVSHYLLKAASTRMEEAFANARCEAERILSSMGMRLRQHEGGWQLAIATSHQGLARLFAGTHWGGRSGAQGVWSQSIRRASGAFYDPKQVRIGGAPCRAIWLPLELVVDHDQEGDVA